MSDLREAFEAHYFSCHGGGNMTFDHANSYYLDSDVNDYWLAFQAGEQAALSANGGEAVPVAGIVQVASTCFKQVLPWDEAKRQHASILSASDSLGSPGDGAELIPLYPAPPSVAVPEGLKSKVLELCSAVENDEDLPPVKYALKCGRLINEVKDILTAAPSPDHSGDANKMGAMLREIVDMWDGPRYALQMKPLIDRARTLLAGYEATPSVPENEIKEILNAVAHIGVDFGYGPYQIEEEHIVNARNILDRLRTAGDEGEG